MKRFALWLMMAAGLGMSVQAETELFTNVYVVPPTLLNRFLNAPSAKSVLEAAGIAFPEGASAIYNAATSQLIVRNTEDQMKLVETYVESIRDKVERQIYVSVREMRFRGELADLLKSAKDESKPGDLEVNESVASLFDFTSAALDKPRGPTTFDSEASFHAELAQAPKPKKNGEGERRIRMTGFLTDPQLQVMVRQLARLRGLDVESLPSVMVRSGQPGMTRKEMQRYGFIAVLGADEFTIDLRLFLPEAGKPLYDEGATNFEPTAVVTIWDGQTVVVAEKTAKGENRLVFVTAQMMDPAGMPIRKEEREPTAGFQEPPTELPSKSAPASLSPEENEVVKTTDRIAEEASHLLAEGKFAEAFEIFSKVLNLLPKHELTKPRRAAYEKQLLRAKDGMAKRTSNTGVHVVAEGETLQQIAARLGIAVESLLQANRLDDAPLKHGQILLIPAEALIPSRTKALLNELILPGIDFKDVNLLQAIMMHQQEILRLHNDGLFPSATPIFRVDLPAESHFAKITLRLSNVPAAEALRYVTALANCRYEVDGREVKIVPHVEQPPRGQGGAAICPSKGN